MPPIAKKTSLYSLNIVIVKAKLARKHPKTIPLFFVFLRSRLDSDIFHPKQSIKTIHGQKYNLKDNSLPSLKENKS